MAVLLPLAALVVAGTSASAQGGGRQGGARNPVSVLVDSAQALSLSADQTARLRTIAQELDVKNRPALDSLEHARGNGGGMGGMGGGEMSPEMRERMERLRPLMQALRDNNRDALEKAMAVLTPEQRDRAQAMLPRGRMGRGGPGGPPPQP